MEIPKDLKNEIWDFCRVNDITNINDFMVKLLRQGFTYEKYGTPTVSVVKNVVEENPVNIQLSEDSENLKNEIDRLKNEISSLTESNQKLKEKSLEINSYPKFQIRSGHEDALLRIKEDFDNWVTEFKKEYNESPEFELETKLSNTYFLKVNNPEFQKKKERSLKAAEDFYKTLKYKGD